jgi:hypothetical protein
MPTSASESARKVLNVGVPASLSDAINPAGMTLSAGIGPVVGQN